MKKQIGIILVLASFAIFASSVFAQTQKALIHYWNFDNVPTAHIAPATPTIPDILPDFTIITSPKARVTYYLQPGTSLTASDRYIDAVPGTDSNARYSVVPTGAANNALRLRNPLDSMELRIFAPTTGYTGIVVKYSLESSSTAHGDSTDLYDYSVDGGATWKNGKANGMIVNGSNVDTLDTTPLVYQGTSFGVASIDLSADKTVENNPNFVFRIRFEAPNSTSSGNNRIDNLTFEGNGAGKGPSALITVKQPVSNTILVSARHATVAFDTSNGVGATKTIEYSTDGGTTWNPVGTTSSTTYDWIVPATPTATGIIRVKDAEGTVGSSSPFVIVNIDPKSNRIIHYWDFNSFSKVYNNPNIPLFPTDFSANENAPGSLAYTLVPGTSGTYIGYVDNVAGDLGNAQFGVSAGQALRVRNPVDSVYLLYKIPTTGFKNISFSYVIEESSNVSPLTRNFDYSVDGGTNWLTTGLSMLTESNLDSTKFDRVVVNFASGSPAENNANLIFRIRMTGSNHVAGGNDRYDNITVEGDPGAAGVADNSSSQLDYKIYPNPAKNILTISSSAEESRSILIIDITGRVVLKLNSDQKDISINISTLSAGMYTALITDVLENKNAKIKFVKE